MRSRASVTVQAYVVYDADCPIQWARQRIECILECILDLLSNYLSDYKVVIS